MRKGAGRRDIVLITLCRNNPRELDQTLTSVAAQSTPPERHIIIDSSDEFFRKQAQTVCSRFDVEYVWLEPQGIYPAMNQALEYVDDHALVWYLNSSDSMYSPDAIASVVAAVNSSPPQVQWWIGHVRGDGRGGPLRKTDYKDGSEFLTDLRYGLSGFPHTASIVQASAIRQAGGFNEDFNIAADYALALRLGQTFGPPEIIDAALALYDRSGLSSLRPVRTAWQKSLARLFVEKSPWPLEGLRFFLLGLRGIVRWLIWKARTVEHLNNLPEKVRRSSSSSLRQVEREVGINHECPPICIVSVCYNNPDELQKTVASVALQSSPVSHFIVVDSSAPQIAVKMKKVAERANATYVWSPPLGVYAAMLASLDHAPENAYVWWVNSSDWLAGKKSVEQVRNFLKEFPAGTEPSWIVGNLIRLLPGGPSLHRRGDNGTVFWRKMSRAQTGFPHPSSLFRKELLMGVAPYSDNMEIASDYATALRFGRVYGEPDLLDTALSIHVPSGLTARHPLQNIVEKLRSRVEAFGTKQLFFEPARLARTIATAISIRMLGESRLFGIRKDIDQWPLLLNQHFCNSESKDGWPACCDRVLAEWGQ